MTAALAGLVAASAVVAAGTALAAPAPRALPAHDRPEPAHEPGWLVELCAQLQLPWTPGDVHRAARAAAAASVVACTVLVGPAAGALAAGAALVTPRLAAPALARRRDALRDRQLPSALERVATAMRAGTSLPVALAEVATAVPGPLGAELRAVVARTARGRPLAEAVQRWTRQHASSSAVVLAGAALELGTHAGGQVARALDGVASTLRDRQQVRDEAGALATQARTSAWLLALAPVAFTALVSMVEPGTLRFLLTTPVGLACLALGAALDVAGLVWMARIVRRGAP